jgi:hypothetical protein
MSGTVDESRERAVAKIGLKFVHLFLNNENACPDDKELLHDKACQMAKDGNLAQAKPMKAKPRGEAQQRQAFYSNDILLQ